METDRSDSAAESCAAQHWGSNSSNSCVMSIVLFVTTYSKTTIVVKQDNCNTRDLIVTNEKVRIVSTNIEPRTGQGQKVAHQISTPRKTSRTSVYIYIYIYIYTNLYNYS